MTYIRCKYKETVKILRDIHPTANPNRGFVKQPKDLVIDSLAGLEAPILTDPFNTTPNLTKVSGDILSFGEGVYVTENIGEMGIIDTGGLIKLYLYLVYLRCAIGFHQIQKLMKYVLRLIMMVF
jgi:hypothetical protein